jgi:hypothetical protein
MTKPPLLRLFLRSAIAVAMLTTPLLMVAKVNAGNQVTIEAPAMKKMGAGLVILVSLQRG